VALLAARDWPLHGAALAAKRAVVGGVGIGALSGLGAVYFDSRRREAEARTSDERTCRRHLIRVLGGFTHARWAEYMNGIASLAGSLNQGADPAAVRGRIVERLRSWSFVIGPDLQEIARYLPLAGIDPAIVQQFHRDLSSIDPILGGMIARESAAWEPDALTRLGESTRRLAEAARRIHIDLGRSFNARIGPLLDMAVAKATEREKAVAIDLLVDDDLPMVFADVSQLAEILDNLVRNAVRAALSTRHSREPRVILAARLEAGYVHLSLRDSGPGFDPEVLCSLSAVQTADPDEHGGGLARAAQTLRSWDGKLEFPLTADDEGGLVIVKLPRCGIVAGKS
jgi:hypothetical protein